MNIPSCCKKYLRHSPLQHLKTQVSWPPWYLRDVGEVEGGRWGEDVLEVLGARFLEAMEWGVGVVLGQPLVIQAITRQRHCLVLGQRHTDDLPIHLLAIQVAHCFGHRKENGGQRRGCCSLPIHNY